MRKIIFSTHFFFALTAHICTKKIESNLPFLSVRGIIAQPITADFTIKNGWLTVKTTQPIMLLKDGSSINSSRLEQHGRLSRWCEG